MQHALKGALPEPEESLQLREVGTDIVGLPDIGLEQPRVIGASIQDFGRRQAVAGQLLAKVLRSYRSHRRSPFLTALNCVFPPRPLQAEELSKSSKINVLAALVVVC